MNKTRAYLVCLFSMTSLMILTDNLYGQDTSGESPAVSTPAATPEASPSITPAAPAAVAVMVPEIASESAAPVSECAFVEEELTMLKADRDNILAQVKIAYQQKNEAVEAGKESAVQIEKLTVEKNALSEILNQEKSKSYTHIDKFYVERNTLSEQLKKVRKESYDKIEALEAEKNALGRELEIAKNGGVVPDRAAPLPPAAGIDAADALELKVMQSRNEELRRQIDEIKADKNSSDLQIAEQNSKVQALLEELEAEKSKNRNLPPELPAEVIQASAQLTQFPGELVSVRLERDRLLKETADLHYNLGVSLVQMGEYQRAVKEFLRTLELVPDDIESHFNLGKLYAQHLKNNDEAVRYFEKYIQLQPQAKDMDSVRKFIETVQAYNGEESLF